MFWPIQAGGMNASTTSWFAQRFHLGDAARAVDEVLVREDHALRHAGRA